MLTFIKILIAGIDLEAIKGVRFEYRIELFWC